MVLRKSKSNICAGYTKPFFIIFLIIAQVCILQPGAQAGINRTKVEVSARVCPAYLFVGMRGSGETYKAGSPAGELGATLAGLWLGLALTPRFANLPYNGVASYKAGGVALTKSYYNQVVNESGTTLLEFLQSNHSTCPTTRYILAGYSQGAYAVRKAVATIEEADTQQNKLSSSIAGAVLLGDPGKPNVGALNYGQFILRNGYLDIFLKFLIRYKDALTKFGAGHSLTWIPQVESFLKNLDALGAIQPALSKLSIAELSGAIPVKLYDKPSDPVANAAIVIPPLKYRVKSIVSEIGTYENPINYLANNFILSRFLHPITLNNVFEQFSLLGSDYSNLTWWHTNYQSTAFARDMADWLVANALGATNINTIQIQSQTLNGTQTTVPPAGQIQSVVDGKAYNLDEVGPGGGTVYYYSAKPFMALGSMCGTSCHYLEFVPPDWVSNSVGGTLPWSLNSYETTAGETGLGRGHSNSLNIPLFDQSPDVFANLVVLYPGTDASKGEWYVPDLDELALLSNSVVFSYLVSRDEIKGSYAVWSSTDACKVLSVANSNTLNPTCSPSAFYHDFGTHGDVVGLKLKSTLLKVILVRAF